MCDGEMRIFYVLHVIGGDHQAHVAQRLHLAALKAGDADDVRACVTANSERLQNVGRIAAAADGEEHIAFAHEIQQLLGKYIFIARVVGPCGHQRSVISQRQCAEAPLAIGGGAFGQIGIGVVGGGVWHVSSGRGGRVGRRRPGRKL